MVSIRQANVKDLLQMQTTNLWCLPENYQVRTVLLVFVPVVVAGRFFTYHLSNDNRFLRWNTTSIICLAGLNFFGLLKISMVVSLDMY